MNESCSICCEKFNKSNRNVVQCPNKSCNLKACKECVRTYLLNTTQSPHCMGCRQAWSNYFIAVNLNKTYVENQYMEHRKKVVMEREKSKMPDTMNDVDNYVKGEELEKNAKEINEQIRHLDAQRMNLLMKSRQLMREASELKTGKVVNKEKKKFIMPCPKENCRGFLSTSYKCGACSCYVCKDCLEVLDNNENNHVCNEEKVQTANYIKSTTKPCPTCGERISKIEGCDQMWCISCHTAFSWRTGVIETGTIHNPHYYQYQRNNNNGQVIRNPGDVLCGGIPNWFGIRRDIRMFWIQNTNPPLPSMEDVNTYTDSKEAYDNIQESVVNLSRIIQLYEHLHRSISHITHVNLRECRNLLRNEEDYKQLRVLYILKKIDEKEISEKVCKGDLNRMKTTELLHIYELMSVVGIELFSNIRTYITETVGDTQVSDVEIITTNEMYLYLKQHLDEFKRFIDYYNYQLKMISVSYSCRIQVFNRGYELCSQKSTLKSLKESAEKNDVHSINSTI